MKISLKHKLIFSYSILALIMIVALLFTTDKIFRKQFNNYIIENQEIKNQQIVSKVLNLYDENKSPTYEELYKLGLEAFSNGMIFMVNENVDNQLICMSDIFPSNSNIMLHKMESTMKNIYPNFQGEYVEKTYILEKNNIQYGYVTLGYFGPFYYNDLDIILINSIQKIHLIIGVLIFILAFVVGVIMAKKISKPITIVSKKTKEIELGNYKESIKFKTNTIEINNLINSVNSLSNTLKDQYEIKKQMARNYSHEIRTPLMCIMSTIEGIVDGVLPFNKERLQNIHTEVERLSKMVSQLDKLVETSTDEIILEKTQFDLITVINEVISTFEKDFKNKNIELKVVTKLTKAYINADKDKIKSVFINLISNAYKYTDCNNKVTINLSLQNNQYEIKVIDTGIGIEQSELNMIFEYLYRVEKSRVKDVDGFGIGLSLCKNIVLAHKGTIYAKSQINKGSQFIVNLPIK